MTQKEFDRVKLTTVKKPHHLIASGPKTVMQARKDALGHQTGPASADPTCSTLAGGWLMAADVSPPRIVRSTTNMEDAAEAARARAAEVQISNLIDNSLGDLQVVEALLDAIARFTHDALREVRPAGGNASVYLCDLIEKATVFAGLVEDRLEGASGQLRTALFALREQNGGQP
ncbi:hypothetical protein [Sphingopyxis macrogoltabida]|uniref:hypothetical protein n=1 Tax=Sphingopyxis macrogoltabida TaxID=33050 RepID=UPI0011AB5F0B|nr:hypothetical protein [Sphingopyxis macrogoltabida]